MRFSLSLFLLWCSSMAGVAAEQIPSSPTNSQEALQWLQKMTYAVHTLDYEGRFVFHAGGQLEIMDIQHRVDADGEHERLKAQSGEPREVIRDNERLLCISNGEQQASVTPSFSHHALPGQWLANPEKLLQAYHLQMLGTDRMTGRSAQVVAIMPLDSYRYGYRVWLDEATALLLKTDLLTSTGQVLEQLMFTRLEVMQRAPQDMPEPGDEVNKTVDAHGMSPVEMKQPSAWTIDYLPQYFTLREVSYRQNTDSAKVEHRLYSDGMATVSVFIEPVSSEQALLNGASSMGAMNAYGMTVDGHQVTVVGEVPQQTVRLMAQSSRSGESAHD